MRCGPWLRLSCAGRHREPPPGIVRRFLPAPTCYRPQPPRPNSPFTPHLPIETAFLCSPSSHHPDCPPAAALGRGGPLLRRLSPTGTPAAPTWPYRRAWMTHLSRTSPQTASPRSPSSRRPDCPPSAPQNSKREQRAVTATARRALSLFCRAPARPQGTQAENTPLFSRCTPCRPCTCAAARGWRCARLAGANSPARCLSS